MAETTFPLSQLLSQFEQRPDAPALITGRHSFSARTLLERACMVADGIQIFQQDEKGKNSVLLPSSDPGGFVVGLLACELTGCTAVPWMDAKLPREAIASLACPAMVLTRDGESLAIRSLDGPRLPQPPRGDRPRPQFATTPEPTDAPALRSTTQSEGR